MVCQTTAVKLFYVLLFFNKTVEQVPDSAGLSLTLCTLQIYLLTRFI